jgi:hypothetical protein
MAVNPSEALLLPNLPYGSLPSHDNPVVTNDDTRLAALKVVSATAGTEASHVIEVACSVKDLAGAAVAVAREVYIETLAVTADKGDISAAGTPVGTLKKAVNPSTGPNVAWMTTTSGGLFSFSVTDSAAEDVIVKITADGCRPLLTKLTFAG